MKPYIVRQGDYLASIAFEQGFDADEVWDHPKNQPLKDGGRTKEILAPGDVLYVPDTPPEPLRLNVGSENHYEGAVPTVTVRVTFMVDGQALANKKLTVLDMGAPAEKTTDGAGLLVLSVPVTLRSVRVVCDDPYASYRIDVGNVDPVTVRSGVIGRLRQLGYLPLDLDPGELPDEELAGVVACFQHDQGLARTGELDEPTQKALSSVFGS
jgi:hypothetical protein